MSELLYHYENPKFAGKPWPADGSGFKRKRKKCAKVCYTFDAATKEAARLRIESPEYGWSFRDCQACHAYHIRRYSPKKEGTGSLGRRKRCASGLPIA